MDLYRTAATNGVADAMNCLGLLLEEGRGESNNQSSSNICHHSRLSDVPLDLIVGGRGLPVIMRSSVACCLIAIWQSIPCFHSIL
jgi:hypothetical protein